MAKKKGRVSPTIPRAGVKSNGSPLNKGGRKKACGGHKKACGGKKS